MRNVVRVLALGSVLVLSACGGGSGGGDDGAAHPPPAGCGEPLDACASSADCCGTCLSGYCMPSPQGGQCATTDDCIAPYLCTSGTCQAASCRQDLDVCTTHAQCCGGHCRPSGSCGANRPPVADAGPDATVDKGLVVSLGGLSGDPDGDPIAFTWTLAKPGGSAAALSSATAARPTFTPDVAGIYTVSVTVTDGPYSASDSRTVTATNTAPVARAGTSRSAPRNTLVQLDASASTDVNRDPITFAWSVAGPAGSVATLSSATDPKPSFTPDVLGEYVVTVTASDGQLSSSASVTITAVNTAPVARLTGASALNAGEGVTLSAATSSDPNGDPLTFTWTLSGPIGTTAVLSSTTGPTASFTTDLEGTYTVTVVASDGLATGSSWEAVVAHPHLAKLGHDVVAAAYAKATDRLVTVSSTPGPALWILDPLTEEERRVDLAAGPPLSVAVSADGLVAVVGRNGGVTEVDLTTGAVVADCATRWSDGTTSWDYDAASVAVGPPLTIGNGANARVTRFAYAAPGFVAHRGDYTMALDLGTCAQSADWVLGGYFEGTAAMRPVTGQLYVLDHAYTDTFYVYATTASGALASRVTASTGYDTRSAFWFTEDGGRFLCQSGDVFDADPVASGYYTQSLTRLGALGNAGTYDPRQLVLHADHSAARQDISIIPLNDYEETTADTVVKRYYAPDGNPASYAAFGMALPLPAIVVDGVKYTSHGRYVFYRSDGSARYVVIRTPPGYGVEQFAVGFMGP